MKRCKIDVLKVDNTGKRPQKRACIRELMARYRKQGKLVMGLGKPGAYCAIGQMMPEVKKLAQAGIVVNDPNDGCNKVTARVFGGQAYDWNWVYLINDTIAEYKGTNMNTLQRCYDSYLKNPNRANRDGPSYFAEKWALRNGYKLD